jgi:hypothetical protein
MLAYLYTALASLVLVSTSLYAQQDVVTIIAGNIRRDTADAVFTQHKIEAGLALALESTGKYRYVTSATRDSLGAAARTEQGSVIKVKDVAALAGGTAAVFASCLRVGNVIRAEVSIIDGEEFENQHYGIGFDIMRLRNADGSPLPDPAILRAMQRALCRALSNNDLYNSAPGGFNTRPTDVVAVGGIAFVDSTSLPPWNLFKDKITVSYDMVETIIHECANDSNRTIIDVESRDAMYAVGGLYMTENYNPITETELGILSRYEADFVITGSLVRTDKGATLNLQHNRLGPNLVLIPLLRSSVPVATDSKTAIRDAVRVAVRQLYGGA